MTAFKIFQATICLVLFSGLMVGCASTPRGPVVVPVQVCGGDGDSDGDGVNNCHDRCPGTLRGEPVGPDGCPLPMIEAKPFKG
jgi:hypothetical protein